MVHSLRITTLAVIMALSLPALTAHCKDVQLTRDEVTVIKRKLVSVADALGQPPSGYDKEEESFDLPTSTPIVETAAFRPLQASAQWKFGGGVEKKAKKSQKELESEYKKKMLEAQAKSDYRAISSIVQEMQQKMMQAGMATENKDPIEASVQINSTTNQSIDPDAVVFEKPGVIALRLRARGDEDQIRVIVYFDPVHLKETKTLSVVDLSDQGSKVVTKKTTVLNAVVELSGPAAEVEEWAKRIATDKILQQIDAN